MKEHEIICYHRKLLGLTQKQVADALFISHNTYSQYETGKREMKVSMFFKIARFLNIDLNPLIKNYQFDQRYYKQAEQLHFLSNHDFLTGIPNRRFFFEQTEKLLTQSIKSEASYSLLLVDIDNFKEFNDRFGHDKGDELLKEVATILQKIANKHGGITCRIGGEELGLFLSITNPLIKIAEQLLQQVSNHPFDQPMTISVGISSVKKNSYTPEEHFIYADQALEQAKTQGKNGYAVYKDLI